MHTIKSSTHENSNNEFRINILASVARESNLLTHCKIWIVSSVTEWSAWICFYRLRKGRRKRKPSKNKGPMVVLLENSPQNPSKRFLVTRWGWSGLGHWWGRHFLVDGKLRKRFFSFFWRPAVATGHGFHSDSYLLLIIALVNSTTLSESHIKAPPTRPWVESCLMLVNSRSSYELLIYCQWIVNAWTVPHWL